MDPVPPLLDVEAEVTTYRPAAMMLAACQIRGARAMLGWSIEELTRRSGVSEKTVRRMEKVRGVQLEPAQDGGVIAGPGGRASADEAHGILVGLEHLRAILVSRLNLRAK